MRVLVAFCTLWLTYLALVKADEFKVVCYYGSWAVYRNGNGNIQISDIDASLCTHLIYAFVGISETGDISILDEWNELADNGGKAGFQNFNALRENSPDTKTLVAIGGWNEGSIKYSNVVANSTLRSQFVKNVVDFTLKYEFDGFDLDWEYPCQRGGSQADVQNYVLLVKELRAAFDTHGLILSAAVAAAESSASLSYDIPQISEYLHFVNIMTYDFHGSWDTTVGFNAPLYAAARETTATERCLNINATVHYWLNQGAAANKLVLGVGAYGRSFTLTNSAQNVPGSPASGAGQSGPYTQESGMLGYNEICELQSQGWTTAWDEEQHVPYAYSGDQWVGFDNVQSVTEKAEFVKAMGLGGAMVWSIETDDFRGTCGEKYPLLNALNSVLRDGDSSSVVSTTKSSTSTETADKTTTQLTSTSTETAGKTTTELPSTTVTENTTPVDVVDGDEESNIICSGSSAAYVRDSQNCGKFWVCEKINDNEYKATSFLCGDGLYFDSTINVCNYAESVDC